ncbi:MAG: hypothetical protein QOI75_2825, partial [Pseudonocardiales bacterium]|nr:hypothetical protein [Pseudonocardiales bacterium]
PTPENPDVLPGTVASVGYAIVLDCDRLFSRH